MTHNTPLRAFAILCVLLALVGCNSQSSPTELEADFTAFDLEGNPVKLSDHLGNIVVLNFWAIWCAPCRMEMPALEAIYQEYRDRQVVILAVNVSESAADIAAFAQENRLTFLMLRDANRDVVKKYGIRSLPTTFFIDREGQVRMSRIGAMTKAFVAQQIDLLL